MIVNESSSIKKIKDATAISKEIGYNEIAYINNNEKIIGDMPISYVDSKILISGNIPEGYWNAIAYGNGKYVAISDNIVMIINDNGKINTVPFFGTNARNSTLVFGKGIFVFLQENTDVYYSYDGLNWTFAADLPSSRIANDDFWYNSTLIYDNINEIFIASCSAENPNGISFGSTQTFSYSIDGINWETGITPYNASVETVVYKHIFVAENGEIYFLTWGGTLYNSNDEVVSIITCDISGVGYQHGKTAIISGWNYGDGIEQGACVSYYSNDNFITWNSIEFFNYKEIVDINYFNNHFVVLTNDGIYISSDCTHWNKVNDDLIAYKLCSNNNQIIALSNNQIYYSYDLINWSTEIITDIYKLEKENEGMYITTDNLIPSEPNKRHIIKESFEAKEWKEIPELEGIGVYSICYSEDLDIYVLSSTNGFYYSYNGVNWNSTSIPYPDNYINVAYGNGIFVSCSEKYSLYSYDGIQWFGQSLSLPTSLYSPPNLCYGKDKFVGTGYADDSTTRFYSIYSYNGIDWTFVSQENSEASFIFINSGEKLLYNEEVFVTSQYMSSTLIYSLDGINWYPVNFNIEETDINLAWISPDLRDIAYGNGKFISVSENHHYMSQDGINWTSTDPIDFIYGPWSIAYGNNKFIAHADGEGGAISVDGINWEECVVPGGSEDEICYVGNKFFIYTPYTGGKLYYKTDYSTLKFEDELTIFSSTIDVEEGSESNHPEDSYYVVYQNADLFTFNVEGVGTYYAEEGMAWREWIVSDYNTNKYINSAYYQNQGIDLAYSDENDDYIPDYTVFIDEAGYFLNPNNPESGGYLLLYDAELGYDNNVFDKHIILPQTYTVRWYS